MSLIGYLSLFQNISHILALRCFSRARSVVVMHITAVAHSGHILIKFHFQFPCKILLRLIDSFVIPKHIPQISHHCNYANTAATIEKGENTLFGSIHLPVSRNTK